MSVIINGTGGGFATLTSPLTLFVRTVPVVVSLSNGSPCVATWTAHGLMVNDPVVFSSPYDRGVCTITIANPGVVTLANHGYALNDPIAFDTSGALPTGLAINTTFFAIPLTVNTFNVAAAPNGAAINTGGAQSGTQYAFRANTIPSGVIDGAIYFVLSIIDQNNFTFSKTVGGAAINSTSAQIGKIIGQTGNDHNTGLSQTRTGAFMTVGKAWRQICGFYNLNAQIVTVQLAHGTYLGGSFSDNTSADTDSSPCFCSDPRVAAVAVFWLGGGEVLILGDASNPDAVKWTSNNDIIDANSDFDGNLTFKGLRWESSASPGFSVDINVGPGFNTIFIDTIIFGNVYSAGASNLGSSPRMNIGQGTLQLVNPCQVLANGASGGIFIEVFQSGEFLKNDNTAGIITGVNNPPFGAIFRGTDNGFVNSQLTVWQGNWNYTTIASCDGQAFVVNHNGAPGNNPTNTNGSATGPFVGDRAFYFEFQSPTTQTAVQFGAPGCQVDAFYFRFVPTTGFSQTLNNSQGHVIIDPAGALGSGTVQMTAQPNNGQMVNIRSSQNITAITFSPNAGQTVVGAPTAFTAGQKVEAIFDGANSTWYFSN